MKILFGYVAEAVRAEAWDAICEAQAAGHDVHFRELKGELGYWAAMCEMFAAGESFLNCEHDIALTLDQIAALEACQEPICAYGYGLQQEGDIPPALEEWVAASAANRHADAAQACLNHVRYTVGLGATRFSEAVVRKAAPGILASPPTPFKWLEPSIANHFSEHFGHYHVHEPGVSVRHW